MSISAFKVKEVGEVFKLPERVLELGKEDRAVIFDKNELKEVLEDEPDEYTEEEKGVIKAIIEELEEAGEEDSTYIYWF